MRRITEGFRRLWELRLSTKIMVVFFAISMIAIFYFARQSEARATQSLTESEQRLLTAFASSTASQIESQATQYRRDADQVASDSEVKSYLESDAATRAAQAAQLQQRLAAVLSSDPDYREVMVLDPSGRVVLTSRPAALGQDLSQTSFFANGIKSRAASAYLSDITLSTDTRSQEMFAALPIRDVNGQVLGVAAVRLSPEHLVATLAADDLRSQNLNAYLVSSDSVVLSSSQGPSYAFKTLGPISPDQAQQIEKTYGVDTVQSLGVGDLASRLQQQPSGSADAHLASSRETDVVGWAPVDDPHWKVLVSEDKTLFTAAIDDLAKNQFLNAAVLALIVGSLVIFAGRMFETTERESLSDPLTGLANRRFLQEILLRELRRAQRSNRPVSLIIVDVDHFKRINDKHGHNFGDEVLTALAGLLLSNVRATDFVIRYGGEEFVILQPETRATDAAGVAEKLRKVIEATEIESTAKPNLRVRATISAGVAAFPIDGVTGEEVILKADRALYWAKTNGRNKVGLAHGVETVAEREVAGGEAKTIRLETR